MIRVTATHLDRVGPQNQGLGGLQARRPRGPGGDLAPGTTVGAPVGCTGHHTVLIAGPGTESVRVVQEAEGAASRHRGHGGHLQATTEPTLHHVPLQVAVRPLRPLPGHQHRGGRVREEPGGRYVLGGCWGRAKAFGGSSRRATRQAARLHPEGVLHIRLQREDGAARAVAGDDGSEPGVGINFVLSDDAVGLGWRLPGDSGSA